MKKERDAHHLIEDLRRDTNIRSKSNESKLLFTLLRARLNLDIGRPKLALVQIDDLISEKMISSLQNSAMFRGYLEGMKALIYKKLFESGSDEPTEQIEEVN